MATSKRLPAQKICVQVAIKRQGVAVRDSKDNDEKTLFFNRREWGIFVRGIKNGEFDI